MKILSKDAFSGICIVSFPFHSQVGRARNNAPEGMAGKLGINRPLLLCSEIAFNESRHQAHDKNTANDFRPSSKAKCKNSCYHNDKQNADRKTILDDQVNSATKKGRGHFHGIALTIIQ